MVKVRSVGKRIILAQSNGMSGLCLSSVCASPRINQNKYLIFL